MLRTSDEHASGTVHPAALAVVPAGADGTDASHRTAYLHAQVQATRQQSQALAARFRVTQHITAETVQLIGAALSRTGQIQEQRLAARTGSLPYSAYARMQARLASMPVIEQVR